MLHKLVRNATQYSFKNLLQDGVGETADGVPGVPQSVQSRTLL